MEEVMMNSKKNSQVQVYKTPDIEGLPIKKQLIAAYEDVPIKSLSKEYDQQGLLLENHPVRVVCRDLFIMIGWSDDKLPNKIRSKALYDYIYNELGNFSVTDVKMAFKLAIKGQLRDQKGDPIHLKFYGAFNSILFADILLAYEEYKKEAIADYMRRKRDEEFRKKEEERKRQLSEDEKKKIKQEFLEVCLFKPYDMYFKKGQYPITNSFPFLYDSLVKDGFFKADSYKQFTKEATKEVRERLENPRDRTEMYSFKSIKNQLNSNLNKEVDAVKSQSKILYIKDWMKTIKDLGIKDLRAEYDELKNQ